MNILKALVKTVIEIPISLVKDTVTLGGASTERKSYTVKTYKKILKELDSK